MFKKIQKNKNIILLVILFCSVFGLFLVVKPVLAADTANPVMVGIVTVIGWIAFLLSYVIGYIATIVISVLIWVAQFNNIIGVDAVVKGWVVVRDLCNMFFILILLVVAFSTILRIESYQWKKILPKLLIMAVLINFSKTICGLIIDFSQVIMLTFVNGFAETGTARFVDMFQMQKYGSLTGVSDAAFSGGSAMAVAAGIIMGLFAMIVSVIVILVLLGVLVMRIIMLWVYTILSPIAFLAAAFPAGQKYSSQWWGEFSKNVIVGPVLAFFIWLALLTAGTSSDNLSKSAGKLNVTGGSTISVSGEVTSPNALFSTTNFQSYIITLALLIGGLMVTQQMGGMAGNLAGKGLAAIQKGGAFAGKGILKGARVAGSYGLDKATKATGNHFDFNIARTWGRLTDQMGKNKAERANNINSGLADNAQKGSRIAMVSHAGLATKNLNSWDGIKAWGMGEGKKDKDGKYISGRNKYNRVASDLEEERKSVITNEEYDKELEGKNNRYTQYVNKLSSKQTEIDQTIDPTAKKNRIREKQKIEDDFQGFVKNDLDPYKNKQGITVDDKRAKQLDDEVDKDGKVIKEGLITKARSQAHKYEFQGVDIVDEAKSTVVSEQEKKLAHTDDPGRLEVILKNALEKGNKGLIEATARKLTKQGNYNNIAAMLKTGTGTLGMQDMARAFEKAGMSQQSSRGLVAEMGEIAKGLGQFSAFAAMKMDKGGIWQENGEDEAQAAQLRQKSLMQPQAFARNVGHLGLGHYDDKSGQGIQNESTWVMDKSTTIIMKSNEEALAKQYAETGNPLGMERVASKINQLINNGIDQNSKLVEVMENKNVAGANELARVKGVK